jgi:hypothetical protein
MQAMTDRAAGWAMRTLAVTALLLWLLTDGALAACSGYGGVPFSCDTGNTPQAGDYVLGGSNTSPQAGKTVRWTWGQMIQMDHSLSPVTPAGGGSAQTLATWTGYLAGQANPNPLIATQFSVDLGNYSAPADYPASITGAGFVGVRGSLGAADTTATAAAVFQKIATGNSSLGVDPASAAIAIKTLGGPASHVTASYSAAQDNAPGYTISSGGYNGSTGAVTLTLASSPSLAVGDAFAVHGLTGTGAFADADGVYFVAGAGTSGTTVVYAIATGLTMTITGGSLAAGGSYTPYLEAARADATLAGGELASAYGIVPQAGTNAGVPYWQLVAAEGTISNNTDDPPFAFNINHFGAPFLASCEYQGVSTGHCAAAVMLNPNSGGPFWRGVLIPSGALDPAGTAMEVRGPVNIGIDVSLAEDMYASVLLPNDTPTRALNEAGSADCTIYYLDASDIVKIGSDTCSAGTSIGNGTSPVTVNGPLAVTQIATYSPVTAPAAPASGYTLYVDVADNKLKAIASTGTITTLALP